MRACLRSFESLPQRHGAFYPCSMRLQGGRGTTAHGLAPTPATPQSPSGSASVAMDSSTSNPESSAARTQPSVTGGIGPEAPHGLCQHFTVRRVCLDEGGNLPMGESRGGTGAHLLNPLKTRSMMGLSATEFIPSPIPHWPEGEGTLQGSTGGCVVMCSKLC